MPNPATVVPYFISIPERELIDLQRRLDLARLPEPETVFDLTQGIELDRLKALLDAWRQHDCLGLEKRSDALPHHRTRLGGLDIAFWHIRSPEPTAIPLLLTHGWPGSVLEFEKILGPLTDPVAHEVQQKTPFTLLFHLYLGLDSANGLANAD